MCFTLEVAGIAQVTAGCETANLRKYWAQLAMPSSFAQGGNGFPLTLSKSPPSWNGRLTRTAIPRSAASGKRRRSASRSSRL